MNAKLVAIAGIFFLLALFLLCLAGLRINGTHSFPVGLYWAVWRPARKADLVFVSAPAHPEFELARERGYLDAGFTPAGTCALIKQVAAVAGDLVTIDACGVSVNGTELANSAPCSEDGAGRPLRAFTLRDYTLSAGEVLLMSEYSARSFDSRYFGPLSTQNIRSVVVPVLTWR